MYADPHACPDCREPISAGSRWCDSCGLVLTGPEATELFRTLEHADALVGRLRARSGPAGAAPSAPEPSMPAASAWEPPAPAAGAEPGQVAVAAPHEAPGRPAPPLPPYRPGPPPEGPLPPRRQWSVPAILLTLGGLCLAVGAIVFLAVTWSILGVGGRTAILVGLTVAAGAGTYLCARKELRGAAETLAALTAVLLGLDLAGGFAAGWFGSGSGFTSLAISGAVVAVASIGSNLLLRLGSRALVAPQVTAVLAGLAGSAGAVLETDGSPWTSAITAVLALAMAGIGFHTGQPVLRRGGLALAGLLWCGLGLQGLLEAGDDVLGSAPYDVAGLVLTGVVAAAVTLLPARVLGVALPVRVLTGVAALWAWTIAGTLPLLDSITALTTVVAGLAAVTAVGVLAVARLAPGEPFVAVPLTLRGTAGTAGLLAGFLTGLHVLWVAMAILVGVVDAGPGWLATYPAPRDFESWVPLVGGGAVVALLVAARERLPRLRVLAAVAAAAVALTVLGLLPYLLIPATGSLLLAVGAAAVALRGAPGSRRRTAMWAGAVVLGLLAVLLTSYQESLLLVALAAAAVAAVVTTRLGLGLERPAAAAVTAPLVAVTLLRAGTLAELTDPWPVAIAVAGALVVGVIVVVVRWVFDDEEVGYALHAGAGLTALPGVLVVLATDRTAPALVATAAVAGYAAWLLLRDDQAPGIVSGAVLAPALALAVSSAVPSTVPVPWHWETTVAHLVTLGVVVAALLVLWNRPQPLRYGLLGGAAVVLVVTGATTAEEGSAVAGLLVAGATALVLVAGMRWSREHEPWVIALTAPPLVASTAWYAVEVLRLTEPWRYAAALVAAPLVVLGAVLSGWARPLSPPALPRWAVYAALAVVWLLGAVGGTDVAEWRYDALGVWLPVYLTVGAATAAVLGIAERNRWLSGLGGLLAIGALWVRLADQGVDVPEAYSLPLAVAVLAFGAWTFFRDPSSRSILTLGPGLALGLVPTLAMVATDPIHLRAVLLGMACLGLVGVGAVRRWQAPLLIGALVGAALVVRELLPYQGAVPRWVLISVAGLVLLVAGIRWEQLATLGRRAWGRITELR